MPSVVAITVYYNRETKVADSVKSLLDQSYSDKQILAVDDGSTDGTLNGLAAFVNPQYSVISKANSGFTRSLIHAIESTDSEFIAIHGSGDISHEHRLARQVDVLRSDDTKTFCATSSITVDSATGLVIDQRRHDEHLVRKAHLWSSIPFTHGSVVIRRSAYEQAGGYEPMFQYCSDWDLWFRLCTIAPGAYLNQVLYTQYAQEDGASFDPRKAISQIKYVFAAKKLAALDPTGRREALSLMSERGVDALVANHSEKIGRALRRRQVKLELIGRPGAANALEEAMEGRFPPASATERLKRRVARSMSRTGIKPGTLLGVVRRGAAKRNR